MPRSDTQPLLLPILGALLLASSAGLSGQYEWHEHDSAYDQARRAVSRGEALPLHTVRDYLHRAVPGKIVATNYEYEFDRWVYEFKIIDPQGQLRKVHIDARSGELVMVSDN
jgi:uncharacterized membrane protein YkoI